MRGLAWCVLHTTHTNEHGEPVAQNRETSVCLVNEILHSFGFAARVETYPVSKLCLLLTIIRTKF